MTQHYRVAVIGGGIVGCSILYHLTKLGWRDVVLLERAELTAGSTWHAAGGMHTLNGNASVAALQKYTLGLYDQLEAELGTRCGIHRTGGIYLATSQKDCDFFLAERAKARALGIDLDFINLDEVERRNPLLDLSFYRAAMFDPNDGHVDPSSATHALAQIARNGGATIHRACPVTRISQGNDGSWRLETPFGEFATEYVVNAAGLWAREVAALAGHRVPCVPLEHQYLVTNEIAQLDPKSPIATTVDFGGALYMRQEGRGLLLGTYEQDCRHWALNGTPLDFGVELLPPDLERMTPELDVAMHHVPALAEAGIKRVVNGAMMFTPDGNPAIGPVPGLERFYAAVGCMAGFSQGGGVGLAVASWIVEGDPGFDAFAMDIARFHDFATPAYVIRKSEENYRRRFIIPCPNEELPAARRLRCNSLYEPQSAGGAVFGVAAGWEVPLWFAGKGESAVEQPTYRRSVAHDAVLQECQAVRQSVGLFDISPYCKIQITGTEAAQRLERIVANHVPDVGRVSLCPMLNSRGRIVGDTTVFRLDPDRMWMIGSPFAEGVYLRWLRSHLGRDPVCVESVSNALCGLAITGPRSRELLERVSSGDEPLNFLRVQRRAVGVAEAVVARISFTGELGYEIYVQPHELRHLYDELLSAGEDLGLRPFGLRALNALRLEKGYGSWGREYSSDVSPVEAGLSRFVRYQEKTDFIGRDAILEIASRPATEKLTLMTIEVNDADPAGGEPVFAEDVLVGRLTSAAYSPMLRQALGFAYVPVRLDAAKDLYVEVLGEQFRARILSAPPHDPSGDRLRV